MRHSSQPSASPRRIVGVTGPSSGGRTAYLFTKRALARAGATTIPIRCAADWGSQRLGGLVLGGGADIHPQRYRQPPSVAGMYDPARDELELAILEESLCLQIPILGICRGAQLLNVHLGGTLHQDLGSRFPGHPKRPMILPRKRVDILPRTTLHAVVRTNTLRVNSLHRQGIDTLGQGLMVSGRDPAGAVQAVERSDAGGGFVLGVQWHPEYLPFQRAQSRLFVAFANRIGASVRDGRGRRCTSPRP